jgi:glutathione S-transferase
MNGGKKPLRLLVIEDSKDDCELLLRELRRNGYELKHALVETAQGMKEALAIAEWAAERVPALWPADPIARVHARAAACEMHSGFGALRSKAPCNIRRRAEPRTFGADVLHDVARLETLWGTLRSRFGAGGPYLFGATPTITDAFFTPVATRFRTYRIPASSETQRYLDALLAEPAFKRWEEGAAREPLGMPEWDDA